MSSRTTLGIIVLVILAGGIWYMQGISPEPVTAPAAEQAVATQNNKGVATNEPAETGKVDDIMASFDSEGVGEAAAVTAGDTDADTVLSDGDAINDLSQTYDETTL